MSLRRERVHEAGYANIDFRTKKDIKALEIFQPWKLYQHYGTMNDYGIKLSFDDKKTIFSPSKEINMQKNLIAQCPDPKTYQSAEFYKKNRINLKTKSLYTNERFAQLDESEKGKDRYVGDSMMIVDINKERIARKKKRKNFIDKIQLQKENLAKNLVSVKANINKEAIQETQLVKINANVTLEGKVDINKIKEVRLALRRRYANRSNFNAIFTQWKRSMANEITVYDAHKMINDLSIPINFNETRALIASSNKRGTESLDLEEFIDLIFSDNQALNLDLNKLQFQDEQLYTEGEQVNDLKKKMRLQLLEKNRINSIKFLEKYFRAKKPLFLNKLKLLGGDESDPYIDLETLTKVMEKFNLPQKYTDESIMKTLFEEYKDENSGKMNYIKFLDKCLANKEENDFFDFDTKYLDFSKKRLDRVKTEVAEKKDVVLTKYKLAEDLKNIYEQQEKEYREKRELEKLKYMPNGSKSHCQPSTEFINLIFGNREKNFEALNKIESEFDPMATMVGKDQRKTRFGGNPRNVNTFTMVQPREDSPMYLNEVDRFGIDNISERIKERELKKSRKLAIYERIKTANDNRKDSAEYQNEVERSKKSTLDFYKCARRLHYDTINKERNDIIE